LEEARERALFIYLQEGQIINLPNCLLGENFSSLHFLIFAYDFAKGQNAEDKLNTK
jgi:hypothetical protein